LYEIRWSIEDTQDLTTDQRDRISPFQNMANATAAWIANSIKDAGVDGGNESQTHSTMTQSVALQWNRISFDRGKKDPSLSSSPYD
jgi:hypothetical protein